MLISLKDLGHEYMVGLIDKLAGTLFNYASSRGIAVDMPYCRKMMWGGTFSELDSYEEEFTPDERDEISAIVNA